MRQPLLLLLFLLTCLMVQAQRPYNQWAAEASIGAGSIAEGFAPGYDMNGFKFPQVYAGGRYMHTTLIGLSGGVGFQTFNSEGEDSQYFNTLYARLNAEIVLNFGTLLGLRRITNRFNLLAHAGGGLSFMSYDAEGAADARDDLYNWRLGVTPQLRITDRLILFGDLSLMGNLTQDMTYDGTVELVDPATTTFDRRILNVSIGITIFFGNMKDSADFYSVRGSRGGRGCYF